MRAPRITVALLVLASLSPSGAQAVVTAVNPVKDSGINESQGTSCQQTAGSAQSMFVGTTCGKGNCADHRSLLHFDISAIPRNAFVASAGFHFNVERLIGSAFNVKVFWLAQPAWTESGVTYSSYDCPAGLAWVKPGGDFSNLGGATWHAANAGDSVVDVTALVRNFVYARSGQAHIIMKAGKQFGADRYIEISTRESVHPPVLSVVWFPATPTSTATPTPIRTATRTSTATPAPNPCDTGLPWTPIGPAPYELENTVLVSGATLTVKNSGIVKAIAIDPQSTQESHASGSDGIYVGTRAGGLWQTTDGGITWSTTTDDLAPPNKTSLEIETIAVHPTNQNVILAGTGVGAKTAEMLASSLDMSIGVLRSIDHGASWQQIGPTWCDVDDSKCRAQGTCIIAAAADCPGTDPPRSTIDIRELTLEQLATGGVRAWVATSMGVWWSDNAADQSTTPTRVVWQRLLSLPVRQDDVTPEQTNHLLISPLDSNILYASVPGTTSGPPGVAANRGWYRSTDRGASFVPINNGLPPNPSVQRAAIARGGVSGADTLYFIRNHVPVPKCGLDAQGVIIKRDELYRTTDSGQNWTLIDLSVGSSATCEGAACDADCADGKLVVQVDPQDPKHVFFGGVFLYNVTDTGTPSQVVSRIGNGIIHGDQNALTFDPHDPNVLYVGNDGGIWSADLSGPSPDWTFRHGNLANLEFFSGGIDTLNYGVSMGGTQDNRHMKGGALRAWRRVPGIAGGDGVMTIIDRSNSNVAYFTGKPRSWVGKTSDGGGTGFAKLDGLAFVTRPDGGTTFTVHSDTLAMDPFDPQTLVVFSVIDHKVYRTTTAAEPPAQGRAWVAVSPELHELEPPNELIPVIDIEVAPTASGTRSDLIFAGTDGRGVWLTTDASSWARAHACQPGQSQCLPARRIRGFASDTSAPCDATTCTLYVTADRYNDNSGGHVFRSTDAGRHWQDISGNLPNVPASKVVVAPDDARVLFVATDMGVFRGTSSGATYAWCPLTNGLPKTAVVKDLEVHADSGILRAFTFGRSAWEQHAFALPNPELKVNSVTPITSTQHVRVSSDASGAKYSVVWADDRNGANSFHVYMASFAVDSAGRPQRLNCPAATCIDSRVDDTSLHVVQAPTLAAAASSGDCAWVAWQDDRLNPISQFEHVYFQYLCTDGQRLFMSDMRADEQAVELNATRPALALLPGGSALSAILAWQAERPGTGGALHDIYARLVSGLLLQVPFAVNTSGLDATAPAVAVDVNNNVFLAWEESDPSSGAAGSHIMIGKYDLQGALLAGPVQVDQNQGGASAVALAVDAAGDVIATWSELDPNGGQPVTVFIQRLDNNLGRVGLPLQVDQPPAAPPGVQKAERPAVAVDSADNVVIAWRANVNAADASSWIVMGRSFDLAGNGLKNDFRVDLSGRAVVDSPVVARTSVAKKFVFAWRDDRSGHFDTYTRVVEALP